MKIPCDTIARLSRLLPSPDTEDIDEAFKSIRLDNGQVVVTNRHFLAVENVAPFEGVFYLTNVPALIDVCRVEAQYSSVIEITPNPVISYTMGVTSLGAKITDNIGYFPAGPSKFDEWRERLVETTKEPIDSSNGPLVFSAHGLAELAATSPSGNVVLETHQQPATRPTIVRDIDSYDWVGFFQGGIQDGRHHASATLPSWLSAT